MLDTSLKMSRIIKKPHLIFFISAPLILLFGLLNRNEIIDLNIHDTYFVFSKADLSIMISILFTTIGIGYWIMLKSNRKLSKWLNFIHIALTIGGIITIILIPYLLSSKTESEYPLFDGLAKQNLMIGIVTILIFFGQFIYITNLIIGILNKNKNSG